MIKETLFNIRIYVNLIKLPTCYKLVITLYEYAMLMTVTVIIIIYYRVCVYYVSLVQSIFVISHFANNSSKTFVQMFLSKIFHNYISRFTRLKEYATIIVFYALLIYLKYTPISFHGQILLL